MAFQTPFVLNTDGDSPSCSGGRFFKACFALSASCFAELKRLFNSVTLILCLPKASVLASLDTLALLSFHSASEGAVKVDESESESTTTAEVLLEIPKDDECEMGAAVPEK